MSDEALKQALEVAKDAAREAGERLREHFGKIEAESKDIVDVHGGNLSSIVARLDRETEEYLETMLGAFDDSIGFRGEESGVRSEGKTTWLVDPIDGTSHFVRGLPFCTTMIALIEDGQVMVSVINDFVREEMYWAIRGHGAFMNDTPIHVSDRPLNKSMLSFETNFEVGSNATLFREMRKSAGTFMTINSGYEHAMVASGKLDGRITLQPYGYDWDYAPGSLLIEEAGGIVKNFGQDSYDYRNHDFIATNPLIYAELTKPGGLFA